MLSQRRYRGVQNPDRLKGRILQGDFGSASFEHILSTERFARYLAWAGGNRERALELYRLNVAVSEALYTPLHVLEVALRNRIHAVLSEALGEHWFDTPGLLMLPNQHRQIGDAKAGLLELRRPISPGRVVAALTFGFWVAMLSPTYETLWQKTLHRVARRDDGKGLARKTLMRPLTPVRVLRNRVAHHEPIIDWNLTKHHGSIQQLTTWLWPAAGEWLREQSRFHSTYPRTRVELQKLAVKRSARR